MKKPPRYLTFRPAPLVALIMLTLLVLVPTGAGGAPGLGDIGKIGSKSAAKPSAATSAAKVTISAVPQSSVAVRGGALAVAIVFNHAEHWHIWPAAVQKVLPDEIDSFAIRTSIDPPAQLPSWVASLGTVQWPTPLPGAVPDLMHPGKTIDVPVYQGKVVAYVPVFVSDDAPLGPASLTLSVGYQACNDQICEAPESVDVTVDVRIVESADAITDSSAGSDPALFAGLDSRALAAPPAPISAPPPAAPTTSVGSSFFGFSLSGLSGPWGFVLLALLSALGGFVLNLTPCVLPVIPIKVITLTRHAGTPGRSLVLGLWMAAGVVAFWVGLGVPAALFSSLADPSRLFGIWWLTLGIGAIIAAMGLGIMGLFTFNLPQQAYMVNPEADSPMGSFLFGVMTAVLGLPCFGFVAGALLPSAALIGPAATLVVFAAIGVGMALPYLVLAAKPSWVERLPRTGPASELVKQVMGLLLLAAAAYFVGAGVIALVQDYPYLGKQLHTWVMAILGALGGLWLAFRTIRITKRALPRVVFSIVGLVIAAGGVVYASKNTADARLEYERREAAMAGADSGALITSTWVDYSEPLVARALAAGKVVVMDFTAEWCLNCKALKATVLNVDPVRSVLESDDVVMVRVDLTSIRAPGWEKLRALGQTGIPLLVVQGPGTAEPWLSNAYTSEQVLDAIARASGKPDASSAEAR